MSHPAPMSTAEVAARLGVDRSVIVRRVQAGLMTPTHKLPGLRGAYLFDAAEVERVAAERKIA